MDLAHESREAPERHRIAGDQFDPVAGEPQRRDSLARRQAGAFAEKNFRVVGFHSGVASACSLGGLEREDKANRWRVRARRRRDIVVTGLDPVIHLLRNNFFAKMDGCPGQARARRVDLLFDSIFKQPRRFSCRAVIASEAKQSILSLRSEMDCFASLAMTLL